MSNIFHKCHAYNKVFFRNLNKSAFLSTLYLDPYGANSLFQVLGRLQDRTVITESQIIHSLINHLSRGFMHFCKTNVSASNDSLHHSMCMKPHQGI